MSIHALDNGPAEIAKLPPAALASLEAELNEATATLKTRKDNFQAALTRLFADKAQAAYREKGSDTGTVRFMASNALECKCDVSKKVEWNQKVLGAALNAMAPEDARHYGKVTLAVEEKKYTAAPPAVRAVLEGARTVKAGTPKFSFADATGEE